MKQKELANMHWRDRYEYEAGREYKAMMRLSQTELLACIEARELGHYFQLWRAIGSKGTVEKAGPVLWEFLVQNPGESHMLDRYHCAGALFQVLGMPDPAVKNELRRRVQWDHDGEERRQEALLELKELISPKDRPA